jgi:hypothetical protein
MATKTPTAPHVFRQRSSVVLAAVSGVTGLFLLLSLVRNWADYPRPLFAAWVVFGLAVAWSLFVRPVVRLDAGGVTLRNVVHDVHIPWAAVTDVSSRWNLKVIAGARSYTAWALSSEPERPGRGSGGMFRMPVPGRLQGVPSPKAMPSTTVPKANARSVARLITLARQDYDDGVEEGWIVPAPGAVVQVTWVPLALAALLLPAIVVLALTLS